MPQLSGEMPGLGCIESPKLGGYLVCGVGWKPLTFAFEYNPAPAQDLGFVSRTNRLGERVDDGWGWRDEQHAADVAFAVGGIFGEGPNGFERNVS